MLSELIKALSHLTDIFGEQLDGLRQGFVAFYQPIQAFVDGHVLPSCTSLVRLPDHALRAITSPASYALTGSDSAPAGEAGAGGSSGAAAPASSPAASPAADAAAAWRPLPRTLVSRIALTLASRFCSSSIRTVMNLITGSVTRRRRSTSFTMAPSPSRTISM